MVVVRILLNYLLSSTTLRPLEYLARGITSNCLAVGGILLVRDKLAFAFAYDERHVSVDVCARLLRLNVARDRDEVAVDNVLCITCCMGCAPSCGRVPSA